MDDTIENLKRALQDYDISIEQCAYNYEEEKQCTEWVVMCWEGTCGIQCDKCKNYFCKKHGTKAENRDVWPPKVSCLCINCLK